MDLETTYKIICENSINENSEFEYQPDLVGKLVKEVLSQSMVSDICNYTPLKQPTGYIFGVKPNSNDKIEIIREMIDAEDHIKISTITKETVDDIYNQFKEQAGTDLLVSILKRDIALEQDKNVIEFMNKIATVIDPVDVTVSNIEAGQRYIETIIDMSIIKMATNLKTNMSGFIVATPKIAALLLRAFSAEQVEHRNKMIGYVGSLGERDLYVDYWSKDEDYVLVGINSKDDLKGVFFCPYDVGINYSKEFLTGSNVVRINNRYGIARNPIDNKGEADSVFFVKFGVNLSVEDDDAFNQFLTSFNNEITPEVDPS